MRVQTRFVFAALLCALLGAAPATQKSALPPIVGEKAADFSLNTLDGKAVSLAELNKDGPVVVIQLRGWVGYQCPLCNKQVGDFLAHSKQILATGARVVMIYPGSADGLKEHAEAFIGGKGLPQGYFFVLDPGLEFVSSWNLRWDAPRETAYPATYVIGQDGIVRFSKVSKSHGDRASSADVLKALAEMPAPKP